MVNGYGPQGLTWDYDDNGKIYLTELGLRVVEDGNTEMTGDYRGFFKDGVNCMNFDTWNFDASNPDSNGESYNYQTWASYNASLNYDILNDWRAHTGFTTYDEYLDANNHVVAVGTVYSEEKKDDVLELQWTQVSNTICDYSWKAIYAQTDAEFDQLVKEMMDKADGYGYEEVCDFYRAEAVKRKTAEDLVKN